MSYSRGRKGREPQSRAAAHARRRFEGRQNRTSIGPDLDPVDSRPPVVQRKFGFEIETRLILSAGAGDADTHDPRAFAPADRYLKKFPVVATGDGFKVHLDHTGTFKSVLKKGPIAEMVTDPPIDEATQSEEEAAGVTRKMAEAASSMGQSPTTPSRLSSKQHIKSVENKGREIFVGFPEASGQNTYGYVQATIGVKLAAVPAMLTHMAGSEMAMSDKAGKIFTATVENAHAVTSRIEAMLVQAAGSGNYEMSDAWSRHRSDEHDRDYYHHAESGKSQWAKPTNAEQIEADFRQLEGFLALALQYLIAGRDLKRGDVPTNLIKNAIGQFFYKTQLSTLARSMHGWAKKVVADPAWRSVVKTELLAECGRQAGEKMSRAMDQHGYETVKVGVWLDNVLSGRKDDIFLESVNPWSSELKDEVGPVGHQAPSAVIENRRVQPLGGPREFGPGVSPQELKGWQKPSEWEKLARYYYQIATALNATEPEAPPKSERPAD